MTKHTQCGRVNANVFALRKHTHIKKRNLDQLETCKVHQRNSLSQEDVPLVLLIGK